MLRLKELRVEKGLKQSEVAVAVGVSTAVYGYYERGINKPDPDMLVKLADFFGCSVDYLLGREDDFGKIIGSENGVILNADEEELVKAYRKLSSSTKSAMLSTLKSLSEKENK